MAAATGWFMLVDVARDRASLPAAHVSRGAARCVGARRRAIAACAADRAGARRGRAFADRAGRAVVVQAAERDLRGAADAGLHAHARQLRRCCGASAPEFFRALGEQPRRHARHDAASPSRPPRSRATSTRATAAASSAATAFGLLAARMLPPIIITVPLFPVLNALRLNDTHMLLILLYAAFYVSLGTWIMRAFVAQAAGRARGSGGRRRRRAGAILWRVVAAARRARASSPSRSSSSCSRGTSTCSR